MNYMQVLKVLWKL